VAASKLLKLAVAEQKNGNWENCVSSAGGFFLDSWMTSYVEVLDIYV
jgi:hypothetical protein